MNPSKRKKTKKRQEIHSYRTVGLQTALTLVAVRGYGGYIYEGHDDDDEEGKGLIVGSANCRWRARHIMHVRNKPAHILSYDDLKRGVRHLIFDASNHGRQYWVW
jgi:hypothetical protein